MQTHLKILEQLDNYDYYDLSDLIQNDDELTKELAMLLYDSVELEKLKLSLPLTKVKFLLKAIDEAVRRYSRTLYDETECADLHLRFVTFAESCLELLTHDIKSYRHALLHIFDFTIKLSIYHLKTNNEGQFNHWRERSIVLSRRALECTPIDNTAPSINYIDRFRTYNLRARGLSRILMAKEKINQLEETYDLWEIVIRDILLSNRLLQENSDKFDKVVRDSKRTFEDSVQFLWGQLIEPFSIQLADNMECRLREIESEFNSEKVNVERLMLVVKSFIKYLALFLKMLMIIENYYVKNNYQNFILTHERLNERIQVLFGKLINKYYFYFSRELDSNEMSFTKVQLLNDIQTFLPTHGVFDINNTTKSYELLTKTLLQIMSLDF